MSLNSSLTRQTCNYYISKLLKFSLVYESIRFNNEIKLLMSLHKYVAANRMEMVVTLRRSRHRLCHYSRITRLL